MTTSATALAIFTAASIHAAAVTPRVTQPLGSSAGWSLALEPASPSVEGETGESPESEPPPILLPAPLPPPPPPPPFLPPSLPPSWPAPPRIAGDRGTSEIALGLGYSSDSGFAAAAGFRYFVIDRVAPGVEASYDSGGSRFSAVGMLLGSLRLMPIRTQSVALVLTGRAGRVLLADHVDGWGAGGGAGVILLFGGGVGLELGYEALRLFPGHFCADLSSCVIQGPVLGIRLTF